MIQKQTVVLARNKRRADGRFRDEICSEGERDECNFLQIWKDLISLYQPRQGPWTPLLGRSSFMPSYGPVEALHACTDAPKGHLPTLNSAKDLQALETMKLSVTTLCPLHDSTAMSATAICAARLWKGDMVLINVSRFESMQLLECIE